MNISGAVPWNKGKAVGQKRPFTRHEVQAIAQELEGQKAYRDLCLFCLGIDTMLRGSDLVQLRVCDVMDKGRRPKVEFSWL